MLLLDSQCDREKDVPEGAVLIREHTTIADLFSCLWFNEIGRASCRERVLRLV